MIANNKIRELREDKDLNQTQISKILNVSQTTYSRYERNIDCLPIPALITLANYYKVSADYILGISYDYKRPER